ncbi:MAG: 5'-deoxynucleotidase [Ruminococcaceae bacterium]|nr:5'-deoxynucleotidase [Oscillospiraceae bacterium]
MNNSFFAFSSRTKYIYRWALMRNTERESLAEHTLEVASLAHALAVIGNKRFGKSYNAERAAVLALYHDTPEIITGDMPTPVKYNSDEMRKEFQKIEDNACNRLLDMLPDDLKEEYSPMFFKKDEDEDLWKLVKAADKLSALIKCIEERKAGNTEFKMAEKSTLQNINKLGCEECSVFLEEFIPAYELTLDQL